MLVSFDMKFIRRDQEQRRNGDACRAVIEIIILVSFDIKFIRRDQKQRRDGKASSLSGETRNSVGMARLARGFRGFLFYHA